MATEKLYLNDPFLTQFSSKISAVEVRKDGALVALEASAFYPESGGQLGDRGEIRIGTDIFPVLDTQVESNIVWHKVSRRIEKGLIGQFVNASVQWSFRRDMMSQHTGQHILSAILARDFHAETVSSRLGSQDSTIDVDLARNAGPEVMLRAQRIANDIIMADVDIKPHYPSQKELDQFDLRRQPTVQDNIRLIEIDGLDITPCGGTHCIRSGMVGPLAITSWENYKGKTRVHFLAGNRALSRLQKMEETLSDLTNQIGTAFHELPLQIGKLKETIQQQKQELGQIRSKLVDFKMEKWESLDPIDDLKMSFFGVPDSDLFRLFIKRIEGKGSALSIFHNDKGYRFVLSCDDAPMLKARFEKILKPLGAKGGGQTKMEGMIPESDALLQLLTTISKL